MLDRPSFWSHIFGSRNPVKVEDKSSDYLREAVDPNAYATAYKAGCEAEREGRLDDARIAFEAAATAYPKDACSWEMLGSTLGNMGRYAESLEAFGKLTELGHECSSCWFNRSIAHGSLNQRDEALHALERTLELDANHSRAWKNQGLILGGYIAAETSSNGLVYEPFDGRQEHAVACFDKAIKLTPDDLQAWYVRGLVLAKLSHRDQLRRRNGQLDPNGHDYFALALASFDHALTLDESIPILKAKCELLLHDGRYVEARDAYGRLVELAPKDAEAWAELAAITQRLGDSAEAEICRRRATDLGWTTEVEV